MSSFAFHSLSIQWKSRYYLDGRLFGSKACMLNAACTLPYGYLWDIRKEAPWLKSSGLNTICRIEPIRPILSLDLLQDIEDSFTAEILQLEKVHQALTIIQFKLESQLIKDAHRFQMEDQVTLDKIDYWEECLTIDDKKHPLINTCFSNY